MARVQALLKAHEESGSFLQVPADDAAFTLDASSPVEGPGTKIGHYELLKQIGEGGMGLVYLAQQKEPVKRQVALKIIKPGMDSKEVIARFDAERQALALLEHPNIAHVFDAGTTEAGRPYFAMEFVRGMSITRYADDRKLSIEQRLQLFRQVCEGLHYAHQKGIIHRDIKPSNILVSVHGDRAVPKLIDFGISKAAASALTEKTVFTLQGQLLGTPEYMSPEQVDFATQDIDTRSDIYSLGVLLYELLTGVLPFDKKSFHGLGFAEIQRTIREQEPATPSTRFSSLGKEAHKIATCRQTQVVPLARCLHRELEWIPMKAMRKDRVRRYRSASEFADDIQNYLNGSPLIAGPETALYRTRKFVRRHVGSVATASLVAAVIIVGLVTSIFLGCRAEQARKQEVNLRIQLEAALARAEAAEKAEKMQRGLAEQRAEKYRSSLYAHQITAADIAYREGNGQRLRKLLDACPEDLRAWEWERLKYVSDQAVVTIEGDKERVYRLALSPDGKRIVSAGADGAVKTWDAANGSLMMTLRGHEAGVVTAVFSPDGRLISSVGKDKTMRIWSAQSGEPLTTVKIGTEQDGFYLGPVKFSPNGKVIALGHQDHSIKIIDAENHTESLSLCGHKEHLFSLAFTPDGKHILSASADRTIRVWDTSTGEQVKVLQGHEAEVGDLAIDSEGKLVISASNDKTVRIWNLQTGSVLKKFHGHRNGVGAVAFSPDESWVVTGDEGGIIKIWDASNGTELTTLLGHPGPIGSVAFSPDGRRLFSSCWHGEVNIWEPAIKHTHPQELKGRHRGVAFSGDGKYIITGGKDDVIRITDTVTRDEVMHINEAGGCASFSPDRRHIIVVDGNDIKVFDSSSGNKLLTLTGHDKTIWSASYSPDGTRIASGGLDRTVRIWNAITGVEVKTLLGHGEYPDQPDYSPVSSVAFSPDGRLITSGSYDYTVRIWDAETGAAILTLDKHSYIVNDVAFSPDGKRLASASSDNSVRVWDVATGEELLVLRRHDHEVLSVAFSPDGRRIISGSKDESIRIWDMSAGAQVQRLPVNGRAWELCFSPDGKTLAAAIEPIIGQGYKGRIITLWDAARPTPGE